MLKPIKYLIPTTIFVLLIINGTWAHDKNKKVLAKTIFGQFSTPAKTKTESKKYKWYTHKNNKGKIFK